MQELQPIPGMVGRLLGGGTTANGAVLGGSSAAEVRCPRCDSPDTKFCYYNNYNLAQPRHFCRACRRYWTKGGHLRNVPVGGGCRKPKPRRSASAAAAAADSPGKDAVHRDGKAPRSGFAAAATATSSSSTAADGDADADAPVSGSGAFSVVMTEPSGPRSGCVAEASVGIGSFSAGGGTRALVVPPPAPVFADHASVFASLFAQPRPLPAFGCSAQPRQAEADQHGGSLLAELKQQSTAAAGEGTAPFAGGSDGALPVAAGASGWPAGASDAGIFELTGGIAGDASSLAAYWNTGSWTDPDPAVYLP